MAADTRRRLRASHPSAACTSEAARESDLIVEASLRNAHTYLSGDETELFTDYDVLTIAEIARDNRGGASEKEPVVLRHWGGDTAINGVDVAIHDANFPMLPTYQRLLLFLEFNGDLGKYEVFDGGTGAFAIQDNGRLRHLVKPPHSRYARYAGMQLTEAIREIHRLRP